MALGHEDKKVQGGLERDREVATILSQTLSELENCWLSVIDYQPGERWWAGEAMEHTGFGSRGLQSFKLTAKQV